jgi:hypothetical protein
MVNISHVSNFRVPLISHRCLNDIAIEIQKQGIFNAERNPSKDEFWKTFNGTQEWS